ncbi:MAG: ABC transporter ATP-binding protein [Alteromonadaceae bacterium]|nr:ABC transporter ATP-binding protein [Alteromonadaceae bacterium]
MPLNIKSLSHQINDGENSRQLLIDLNLKINQGETIALMGDSGSGKTTLLNLVAGLEPIQQGEINIAGQPLSCMSQKKLSQLRKNHLGIIFQQFNLLSGLNVKDNIEFSAKLAGRYDEKHCLALATRLGISDLYFKLPSTLSGGEMQRVAIARALAAKPKLLLADEPTGNLDQKNSGCVVELLAGLAKEHNTALLMVTHSRGVAENMEQIYQLEDGKLRCIKSLATESLNKSEY